ncbi:MAG: Gfo/Idh/MocA family oxidoreductase [Chloroflexota bacterium]|nr:Gfo/Idh/MocA family oxidoreductase [Chloroflexota bacterium]
MEAIAASGYAQVAAVADSVPDLVRLACEAFPEAAQMHSLEDLLAAGLDGIVIATPSALHAEQAMTALGNGSSVFCQKPLARSAEETRRVVDAARQADRLLAVDLSYRFIAGMGLIRDLITTGELGEVYAANLVFHNAYGPDKAWFYDPKLSGGGCVIDLGIHLVDLALWALGFPEVTAATSRLYADGKPLAGRDMVEDYAVGSIDLASGTTVQLACSWKLQAGRDAVIEASFYGTNGGASLRNVGGSFYDFTAERYRGTSRELLAGPPEEWGGKAAVDWARRLSQGERYNSEVEHLVSVATALDMVYGRCP